MRLAIAIPAHHDDIKVGLAICGMRLVGAIAVRDDFQITGIYHMDTCSVAHARNLFLHKALQTEADWLLMMDADTYHENPIDILSMLATGDAHGAAVIAAHVKQRKGGGIYNTLVRQQDGSWLRLERENFLGLVLPVDRIATSFFAVNCGWIKANMPDQPWFEEHLMIGPEPLRMGSDVAFCEEVRRRGGQILGDGRFEPTHWGE